MYQADTSIVTLDVSQYSFGGSGTSACTVVAAAMVRFFLSELRTGKEINNKDSLSEVVREGVRYYQSVLSSQEHLSVDELGSFMSDALTSLDGGPMQGVLESNGSGRHWTELFRNARDRADPAKHIGIVITKPPETVCVILPPTSATTAGRPGQFTFFDSHSRPQLGLQGAYLVLCGDEGGLIERLNLVFTALPMEAGGADNYMMQMYNMFEGFGFQSGEKRT